ncbi:hypothetical protein PENTCL1PPCAC_17715, partial [Pristionchus entomophagus]
EGRGSLSDIASCTLSRDNSIHVLENFTDEVKFAQLEQIDCSTVELSACLFTLTNVSDILDFIHFASLAFRVLSEEVGSISDIVRSRKIDTRTCQREYNEDEESERRSRGRHLKMEGD